MSTHPRPVQVIAVGPIVDPSKPQPKAALDVRGMFGIGDCIFQRAILRELMQDQRYDSVILDSYYRDMFWDLERDGLKINMVRDRGRIRDSDNRSPIQKGVPPIHARRKIEQVRVTYDRNMIHQNGSILAAMFASAKLQMPKRPDFSLPVKPEWLARWRLYFMQYCAKRNLKVTKPIMVYRPICLNTRWTAPARSPDPAAYDALYKTIRDKFFVVSICDLREKDGHKEWTVGPKVDADLCLHNGELDFAAMCGLFADAALAFTNPGFTPVMAHAIRTPVIIVYGGNETFATTNSVGAHLSPTLAIDIDKPCPCHQQIHTCNKTITLPPAKKRVLEFTNQVLNGDVKVKDDRLSRDELHGTPQPHPRVLIFGTTYVDTPERAALTKMWYELHSALNPGCDLMLVDSASPSFKPQDFGAPIAGEEDNRGELYTVVTERVPDGTPQKSILVYRFKDNIGHLSRNGPKGVNSGGRDGWGRAFCKGLDIACQKSDPTQRPANGGYDYVVHIEGDSLFKHPVLPVIERMRREGIKALTVPVKGTKNIETHWVETGLMFFETEFLRTMEFTKQYDWANRQVNPTPERVIYGLLINGHTDVFKLESWGALRGDKNQITVDNIHNLDWVTHVRNKVGLDDVKLFRKYLDKVLNPVTSPAPVEVVVDDKPSAPPTPVPPVTVMPSKSVPIDHLPKLPVKINLGCGTNKLPGWDNRDADVDIKAVLPWSANYADYIFAEHVIEHVSYNSALKFLKECQRVLKPGGVLRITTPSLEFLQQRGDDEYFKWVHSKGWAPTPDRRGAMHAILHCHGHQTAWTSSLLMSTMYYCGFDQTEVCDVGKSKHEALVGVEGHDKVIGQHFNWIESLVVEGTKT